MLDLPNLQALYVIDAYIIDPFTLAHIGLWAVLGLIMGIQRAPFWATMLFGLLIGIAWELNELIWVEPLLGFKEPILNRAVSDPLADLLGTALGWMIGKKVWSKK